MADFVSKIPSTDFDKALQGGLAAANGAFAKTEDLPSVPVQSVNGQTGAVQLGAEDVGADPAGAAVGAVSQHNVSDNAHNDIRLLIEGLSSRLNALADSDDTTLDQMSEIVAYIKANKSLIDSITTSKVNVSDIINNLTTNVANKPLSAAQGVALKSLVDGLSSGKLDVTAIADWAKASTKPSYTKSDVGLGNVENVKQYSASNPPPYPVTSVNGKTGAVTVESPLVVQTTGQSTTDIMSQKAVTDAIRNKGITDYVVTEAESVLGRVVNAQGTRTFNLLAMTDLHNNGGASDENIMHACQGAGYIADRVKVDVFACLGDHTDSTGADWAECLADVLACNNHIHSNLKGVDELRLIGNHDFKEKDSPMTYKTISAFSENVVWGSRLGGYFHKDYDEYKLRIIGLNTSENAFGFSVTAEQYNWFIETLDLSAKEDAAGWQILILSHIPLDMAGSTVFTYILKAYLDGTSWTDGTYSCDYTDKNQATLIANVHGHIHNLLVDKLYLGGSTANGQIDLYRIAIPEVTELYSNHYSAPFRAETTYSKTSGTAKDTSFNVLCIDLDKQIINAVCYGAGVDRTVEYVIETETEVVNLLPSALTPNDITTVFNGAGYMNGKYASAAEPFYNNDADFFCSGLMPIPAGRTFYIKGCTIDTSLSHTRFGLMVEDGRLINTAVLTSWGTYITVEELGTQYYSVFIDPNYTNSTGAVPYYFYFSASGVGDGVVVSETPIPDSGKNV